MNQSIKKQIIALIHREVIPAIGCTEPIAVALASAKAAEVLGGKPERVEVYLSANILKNAMGVGIPGTGMVGLPIAIALGSLIGRSAYGLEVLKDLSPEGLAEGKAMVERKCITIALKEQVDQLQDKVKRQLAEFENFRNRTEKEKSAMFETGAKSVIEKMLPIVDNFERGLATVTEDKKEDPFVDGMNRVYKQLLTELDNIGVKPIEAVGQEFDPNLHNAVMQEASEEYESGVVVRELQKGYTYRDSVVRHSMVVVAE